MQDLMRVASTFRSFVSSRPFERVQDQAITDVTGFPGSEISVAYGKRILPRLNMPEQRGNARSTQTGPARNQPLEPVGLAPQGLDTIILTVCGLPQVEGSPMRLEMFLDYRSVYSYLACHRVRLLDTEIDYRVVDIGRVMKALNNQPVPTCPAKQRYAALDASRWAKLYGIGYSPNFRMFEAMASGQLEGALLARAGLAAQELGVFETFNRAMFTALWAGDDDLASEAGRDQFLRRHDLPASLFELSAGQAIVERLRRDDNEAIERGIFGVPAFFVDGEMFFGNDRLAFVEARLRGERKPGTVI